MNGMWMQALGIEEMNAKPGRSVIEPRDRGSQFFMTAADRGTLAMSVRASASREMRPLLNATVATVPEVIGHSVLLLVLVALLSFHLYYELGYLRECPLVRLPPSLVTASLLSLLSSWSY